MEPKMDKYPRQTQLQMLSSTRAKDVLLFAVVAPVLLLLSQSAVFKAGAQGQTDWIQIIDGVGEEAPAIPAGSPDEALLGGVAASEPIADSSSADATPENEPVYIRRDADEAATPGGGFHPATSTDKSPYLRRNERKDYVGVTRQAETGLARIGSGEAVDAVSGQTGNLLSEESLPTSGEDLMMENSEKEARIPSETKMVLFEAHDGNQEEIQSFPAESNKAPQAPFTLGALAEVKKNREFAEAQEQEVQEVETQDDYRSVSYQPPEFNAEPTEVRR